MVQMTLFLPEYMVPTMTLLKWQLCQQTHSAKVLEHPNYRHMCWNERPKPCCSATRLHTHPPGPRNMPVLSCRCPRPRERMGGRGDQGSNKYSRPTDTNDHDGTHWCTTFVDYAQKDFAHTLSPHRLERGGGGDLIEKTVVALACICAAAVAILLSPQHQRPSRPER